jgi:hypothetical protein
MKAKHIIGEVYGFFKGAKTFDPQIVLSSDLGVGIFFWKVRADQVRIAVL